eukprot:COSAG03_NODE_7905_length_857_cov_1.728232_1_plen_216_part_10
MSHATVPCSCAVRAARRTEIEMLVQGLWVVAMRCAAVCVPAAAAPPLASAASAVECVQLHHGAVECGGEVFYRAPGGVAHRVHGRSLQASGGDDVVPEPEPVPQPQSWQADTEEAFGEVLELDGDASLSPLAFWMDVAVVIVLVLAAGLFSGLNIGLMALDAAELKQILTSKSGSVSERDRNYARRVLPVVKDTHHVLVTLLLCNCVSPRTAAEQQ